ncbi:hypothetical protein H5410_020553 [Solanum commersonii]|uniref:Uncharacterized protein n=1 Tax=Solanum commersonii TaxID=4109 RepID=A0A9J5ZBL4_SOLCO|nr:hypothetical protein H5410_020553 [Solanum commersonii]
MGALTNVNWIMGRLERSMIALQDSMSMMGYGRINMEDRVNPTITPKISHQTFNTTPINQVKGCEEETPEGVEGEKLYPCEGRDIGVPNSLMRQSTMDEAWSQEGEFIMKQK